MENNFTTYQMYGRKGVDDLKQEKAYYYSWGQGDNNYTNSKYDVERAKENGFYCKYLLKSDENNLQAIIEELEQNKLYNKQYIEKLHAENEYRKEYKTYQLKIQNNDMYDKQSTNNSESYRFDTIILNNNNNDTKKTNNE